MFFTEQNAFNIFLVLYIIEFFLTIEKELIKKQFAIVFLSNKILICNLLFIGQYEYASTLKVILYFWFNRILIKAKKMIIFLKYQFSSNWAKYFLNYIFQLLNNLFFYLNCEIINIKIWF